jgi:hypothetical protein
MLQKHPLFQGKKNSEKMFLFNKTNIIKKRLFQLLFGITFLFFTLPLKAQLMDTAKAKIIKPVSTIQRKSPKKAALYSTVLPGLGQAYNKKYWKIPIIYGGFAALAYGIYFNQTKYVNYKDAYLHRIDGDPTTNDIYVDQYTDDNLITLQRYYHRYRDLSVIGAAILYIFNIVDASVDAHLSTFDVDDKLSLNIHPTLMNTASNNRYTTGLSVRIKF